MRDLSHENVNQFIGLTIDPPNICILTKCAAKGSLSVRPDSEIPVILYYTIRFYIEPKCKRI